MLACATDKARICKSWADYCYPISLAVIAMFTQSVEINSFLSDRTGGRRLGINYNSCYFIATL